MITFYLTGYLIVFIAILLLGTRILANDDEDKYGLIDLLLALMTLPFLSWLLVLIVLSTSVFLYLKEEKDQNV